VARAGTLTGAETTSAARPPIYRDVLAVPTSTQSGTVAAADRRAQSASAASRLPLGRRRGQYVLLFRRGFPLASQCRRRPCPCQAPDSHSLACLSSRPTTTADNSPLPTPPPPRREPTPAPESDGALRVASPAASSISREGRRSGGGTVCVAGAKVALAAQAAAGSRPQGDSGADNARCGGAAAADAAGSSSTGNLQRPFSILWQSLRLCRTGGVTRAARLPHWLSGVR